jgi:hypothetical protein
MKNILVIITIVFLVNTGLISNQIEFNKEKTNEFIKKSYNSNIDYDATYKKLFYTGMITSAVNPILLYAGIIPFIVSYYPLPNAMTPAMIIIPILASGLGAIPYAGSIIVTTISFISAAAIFFFTPFLGAVILAVGLVESFLIPLQFISIYYKKNRQKISLNIFFKDMNNMSNIVFDFRIKI